MRISVKKIVFFDIDGTIYHYKHGVIEDTKNAIRELRENGHLAVLCTGSGSLTLSYLSKP